MPIEQRIIKTTEQITDPVVQKQKVFKKIEERFPEYRELINHTEANPIAFVFQHSVADGLELAKKLGMTPEEIRKTTIENPGFVLNHHTVADNVMRIFDFRINKYKTETDNIHLKNILYHMHPLNNESFEGGSVNQIYNHEKARTFFEASFEKRKKELTEFPKETINSIADYYTEFLPYQVEKVGNPREVIVNKRNPDELDLLKAKLEQGKKLLFPKYIEALTTEISENYLGENYADALSKIGIPDTEVKFIADSLRENAKPDTTESFPTLVINHGNGGKMNFNMEVARKPVARIREKIIEHDMTKLAEDLTASALGYGGSASHYNIKIVNDEVLRQHIVNKEEKEGANNEEIQEALFKGKEFFQQYDVLLRKYNIVPETLGNKSFNELQGIIEETIENNEDIKHEVESIQEFHDQRILKYAELPVQLEQFSGIQSSVLRNALEYQMIEDRIDDKQLKGIAQFLYDASEQKIPSALTEDDIGKLFVLLEDEVKKDFPYFNPEIKDSLQQLDCLKYPDIKHLNQYFVPKSEKDLAEDEKKRIKETRTMFERSKEIFTFIKSAMKDKAKWLLELFSLPAKPDNDDWKIAERLVAVCYPEEWQKYLNTKKEEREYNKNKFPFSMEGLQGMMGNEFESKMSGSNVGAKKNNLESNESGKNFEATFDKSINTMLVSNVVTYDSSLHMWKRTHIPVDGDIVQNRKFQKVSAQLKNPMTDSVSVIPAPFASKEFSTNKQNIEKDSLGIHTAIGNESLSTWSYEIPIGSVAMNNVSEQTYTRFLDRLIDEGGSNYIEKIPGLPLECQMFLDSIKNLSPRDRVQQIQNFVTSHSFYDSYDNEMRDEMNNASVTDRVGLMQERLAQLRDELGDEVPDKMLFGGVCADFSVVGEMMMKESGIASGTVQGYRINGTKINNDNLHAKNIALWPDDTGKTIMVEVEMTPASFTESQRLALAEQGLEPEPLQQAIIEAEERDKEHEQDLKEKSDEILKMVDEIIGQNGEVGMSLSKIELRNTIIDYISTICTLEDLYVYKRILESYRFSPINAVNADDLTQKTQGMEFMQDEHKRWKDDYKSRDDGLERISNSGKNLIGEIDRLFIKSAMAGTKDQYISAFKNVPSYLHTQLPDNHKKLWKLLETYVENK